MRYFVSLLVVEVEGEVAIVAGEQIAGAHSGSEVLEVHLEEVAEVAVGIDGAPFLVVVAADVVKLDAVVSWMQRGNVVFLVIVVTKADVTVVVLDSPFNLIAEVRNIEVRIDYLHGLR